MGGMGGLLGKKVQHIIYSPSGVTSVPVGSICNDLDMIVKDKQ